jgi:hypothetical protein
MSGSQHWAAGAFFKTNDFWIWEVAGKSSLARFINGEFTGTFDAYYQKHPIQDLRKQPKR